MTRRRVLPVLAALVAALALPASGHAARLHFITGVSDQQAGSFSSPLYTALGFSTARYITPWDVMQLSPGSYDRQALGAWITAAHAAGQDILISFEHSHTRGRERKVPNARSYTKAISLFHKAYPFVRSLSPWNEANRCQRVSKTSGAVLGQPICHNPKAAAMFYEQTRKVCPSCRIVALDVLDQNNVASTVSYIRAFRRYVRHRPKIWGFHNYSDTNRFSTSRTRAMLRATGSGDVWLTETGGIVRFGTSFPTSQKRAARALGCMFTIAKSTRRIKRLYIYQFNGAGPQYDFDAGLINPDGTKRLGWTVVKQRKAGPCHR